MRSYDTLISVLSVWVLIIIGELLIIPIIFSDMNFEQFVYLISFILIILAFFNIIFYFILLRRERKQIFDELFILKRDGLTVFTKHWERLLYSRGASDIPKIVRLLFNFKTLAITQPNNTEELISIIKLCERYRIPLIPRGAGTSGYGGAVPVKNGIIVILRAFDKILSVDEDELTVEVESGVIWDKLENYLNQKGLMLQSYPSSALSSTVGGWISQGGYGVGSAKFGGAQDCVKKLTIIGTEGKEFQVTDPGDFVFSCGTLGIITRLTLKIMKKKDFIHTSVSSYQESNLLRSIQAFQQLNPFYLLYIDYQNWSWKHKIFVTSPILNSTYQIGGIITMSFFEEEWDQGEFEALTQDYELFAQSHDVSEDLWNDRYYTIRLKRKGPNLVVAEVLVPTVQIINVTRAMSKRFDRRAYAFEVITINNGWSTCFFWFPVDQRKWSLPLIGSIPFAFHIFRAFEVFRIAKKYSGIPYSVGLWFSPYSKLILKERLDKMKLLKKNLDPNGIFNPGKIWGARVPRFFPILSWDIAVRLMVPIFAVIYHLVPKKYR